MPSLFSEKNTVFDHGIWDRYSYVSFLRRYSDLASQDFAERHHFDYSLQQDGYYALLGLGTLPIQNNKTVRLWDTITNTNWFRQIQSLWSTDASGKYVAVKTLDAIARRYLLDDPTADPDVMKQIEKLMQEICEQPKNQNQEEDEDEQDEPQDGESDDDSQNDGDGEGNGKGNKEDTGDEGDGDEEGEGENDSGNESEENGEGKEDGDSDSQNPSPSDTPNGSSQGAGGPGQSDRPPQEVPLNQNTPGIGNKEIAEEPTQSWVSPEKEVKVASDKHDAINSLMPYMSGPTDHQIEAAEHLLKSDLNVESLAKFLGFAMRAVTGAHHLTDATSGELTRYKNTTWSERLHPVDLVGLANGDIRTKARMAEGGLRERRYEDLAPRGRGPVILLRDESGSMKGIEDAKAKSLEIALANAFNADHRDLVSIAWSDGPTRICVYGQDDAYFHLRQFYNGGTVIESAMELAVKTTKDYRDGADMLVITDGNINDKERPEVIALADKFHQENGRIWVVLIGPLYPISWADGVITIDEIENSAKLSELIRTMNKKEIDLKGKKVAV